MKKVIAVAVLAILEVSYGFSPAVPHSRMSSSSSSRTRTSRMIMSTGTSSHLYSSQWDDDDEVVTESKDTTTRKSFDDAGDTIKQEQDDEKLDGMGEYDANPAYKSDKIDRVQEAVAQRAKDLGIEKSKVSAEAIAQAEARAKAGVANRGADPFALDLSQISTSGPSTKQDDKPSMFYDVELEMSEEDMIEADPTGQLTVQEQVLTEWTAASWPTFGAALKEVLLLVFVVGLTGGIIIQWDIFLRNTYTNVGFIPTDEEIMQGADNMVLPEGWLDGMSEDDVMNFQNEIGSKSSGSSSPSVDSLLNQ